MAGAACSAASKRRNDCAEPRTLMPRRSGTLFRSAAVAMIHPKTCDASARSAITARVDCWMGSLAAFLRAVVCQWTLSRLRQAPQPFAQAVVSVVTSVAASVVALAVPLADDVFMNFILI